MTTPQNSADNPFFTIGGAELRDMAEQGDALAQAELDRRAAKRAAKSQKPMSAVKRKPSAPAANRVQHEPSAAQLASRQKFADAARQRSKAAKAKASRNGRVMGSGPVARNTKAKANAS